VDGALSTGTFELRVADAYASRTGGDLRALLADLPSPAAWARAAWDWLWDEPAGANATDVALPARDGAAILVGRSSCCDVVVAAPAVSRVHLEITHAGGRWQARDVLVLGDAAIRLAPPA
jgi:hypothetical protein